MAIEEPYAELKISLEVNGATYGNILVIMPLVLANDREALVSAANLMVTAALDTAQRELAERTGKVAG
jgi:hypothetical protein